MKRAEIIKNNRGIALKYFLNFLWKTALAISVVITIISAFSNFNGIKTAPSKYGIIALIISIIVSLILVIHKFTSSLMIDDKELILSDEVVKIANTLYNQKKYLEVVRFGSTISRYLWLNGFNKERIIVGKLVEDASSKEGRKKEQISSLIDDIGWTYHIIGNSEKAKKNINNGIALAEGNDMFYLAAKGHRHLLGIEKKRGNRNLIVTHLKKAKILTEKIIDSSKKDEMLASLILSEAKYFYEEERYLDAEERALESKEIFKDDIDRIVKVFSILGNIYLKQGHEQKAKDQYNQGYKLAKNVRKDEYANNGICLAKIALNNNDFKRALEYLEEAKEIYLALDRTSEVNEINNLINSTKT